jgi:hypothetical protein
MKMKVKLLITAEGDCCLFLILIKHHATVNESRTALNMEWMPCGNVNKTVDNISTGRMIDHKIAEPRLQQLDTIDSVEVNVKQITHTIACGIVTNLMLKCNKFSIELVPQDVHNLTK